MKLEPGHFAPRRVKDWGSYRWAIVHVESGKYLPTPTVVDTWEGPITTTFLYHRTRREAQAALDQYFAADAATAPRFTAETKAS